MKTYTEIQLGESDPNKSQEQKKIEHELICLINSWKPDKNKIRELKKQLKELGQVAKLDKRYPRKGNGEAPKQSNG